MYLHTLGLSFEVPLRLMYSTGHPSAGLSPEQVRGLSSNPRNMPKCCIKGLLPYDATTEPWTLIGSALHTISIGEAKFPLMPAPASCSQHTMVGMHRLSPNIMQHARAVVLPCPSTSTCGPEDYRQSPGHFAILGLQERLVLESWCRDQGVSEVPCLSVGLRYHL